MALRLEQIIVIWISLIEQTFQRVYFGQMRNRHRRVRMRKPDAVSHTETGMTIQCQAEIVR